MNGGVVIVNGPTSSGDGAIDYDGSFAMDGGTLIAVGSSGMAQSTSGGLQAAVSFRLNKSLSAGQCICIKDNDGNVLAAFTLKKNCSSVVFSSAEIANGSSYTLLSGGSASGESEDGLYMGNVSYSGGSTAATAKASTGNGNTQDPGGFDGGSGDLWSRIVEFFNRIINTIKKFFGINA